MKFLKTIAALSAIALSLSAQMQSSFEGSVPSGTATSEELPLSLQQAIERGLKNNLGTLLAQHNIDAARGARDVVRSELLPNVNAHVTESAQQINLAAFGLSIPGFPNIVGPFGLFDARATYTQTLFNLQAIDATRAGNANIKAAEFQYRDARDTVVLVVSNLYLQSAAGASRIEAVRSQVDAADALYKQAVDFKAAGTVPAIDVLRAQVELQNQKTRLIEAQNDFDKLLLRLSRAIGLPDGQKIRLTDVMPYSPAGYSFDDSLKQAYETRMDYQSLTARVRSAELSRKAAAAQRIPTLAFNGDYGAIGQQPGNSHGTFTAAVTANIPIFQGGRIKGEVLQATAEENQQRAQLDDLRGRIAFEVRAALLDLKSAGEQVDVNRSAVDLAREQQNQARDRFAAGVTDNLEVVQAQQAVAAANDRYIASLYAYNLSKASLARAIGATDRNLSNFLSGTSPTGETK